MIEKVRKGFYASANYSILEGFASPLWLIVESQTCTVIYKGLSLTSAKKLVKALELIKSFESKRG